MKVRLYLVGKIKSVSCDGTAYLLLRGIYSTKEEAETLLKKLQHPYRFILHLCPYVVETRDLTIDASAIL